MEKCNTQANEMETTTNSWKTPGASNPGRYNSPPLTRDLRNETEEKEDSEVATVYEEDAALAAGKTEVKESGSPESTVTLLKIVKEDGEKSDEEEVGASEYDAVSRIVSVGIKTDDEKTKEALKEAVATQDQETIERAVEQARNSKGQER